jgi:uncharacterized protein
VVPLTFRCGVIVMAKAPLPGHAKTRLIPALGAEGAARLASRFLRETMAQVLATRLAPVWLRVAPDVHDAAFAVWAGDARVRLEPQGAGDLGKRMAAAFAAALAEGAGGDRPAEADGALIIGTDAPALDAAYLQLAAEALTTHDAVVGPAADGGYALLGLRRPQPALFDTMPWSTPAVLALTRERLRAAALRWAELAQLHDVDEPADLVHVPRAWLR